MLGFQIYESKKGCFSCKAKLVSVAAKILTFTNFNKAGFIGLQMAWPTFF